MTLDSRYWELLDVTDGQFEAPPRHLDQHGLKPQGNSTESRGQQIPARYLDQHAAGHDAESIARSMVRDNYGKLLTVTALRRLFGLTLEGAVKVYEAAKHVS